MNRHIHKLIEALFTDDDDEMLRLFIIQLTGLNTMTIQEVLDLMLTIESEPDPYWKNSRRNVIRPKMIYEYKT